MKKTVFYILLMVFLGGFRSYSADLRATGDVSIQYKENGLEGDKGQAVDSAFHIYLCFGQSNMEGNADIESVDTEDVDKRFRVMSVCDEDLKMGRTPGNWYTAVPPL